jgi:hypothetical protein
MLVICLFLVTTINVFSKSPYESINESSYRSTIRALEKPSWMGRYAYYNFVYTLDDEQYNKNEWKVSGSTIFYYRKGDCEEYAEFYKDGLDYHNIESEIYELYSMTEGHAITIFKYEGKWGYLDSSDNPYHYNFQSKEKAVLNYFGDETMISHPKAYALDEDIKTERSVYYLGIDRIDMDKHIVNSGYGLHLHLPGFPYYDEFYNDLAKGYGSYYKSPHKEAVGYLYELNKFYINGIGGAISTHGYYSSLMDSNKMGSIYLTGLNSRIGISGYFGDYTGIDFDFKVIDFSFLKSFVCIRNFDILDVKFDIDPFDFGLGFVAEKWDQDYLYGLNYILMSEKNEFDLILNVNNKKSGLTFNSKDFSLNMNYSYRDLQLADINIKVGI